MSTATAKVNGQRAGLFAETWAALGSLRLFIPLISTLAAAVALGTQLTPESVNNLMQRHPDWAGPIRALGLGDPFHTFWFQALLVALTLNLVACVTRRLPQLPSVSRLLYRPRQEAPPAPGWSHRKALSPLPAAEAAALLAARGLRAQQFELPNGGRMLYAERGVWGVMGPWITHIGVLLIMAGGLYGSMAGFKSYVEGSAGAVFTYADVLAQMRTKPRIAPRVPQDWKLTVDKFWIDYSEQGQVKQYYSTLTARLGDGRTDKQTIWVNRPLELAGMTFYQANWGIGGMKMRVDGKPVTLAAAPMQQGGWIARWPEKGMPRILFGLEQPNAPLMIFEHGGDKFVPLAPGATVTRQGHRFSYEGAALKTGLEVGYDPGYPLVIVGFLVISLGVWLAWIAHTQVWLRLPAPGSDDHAWLAGWSPRGRLTLDEDLNAIAAAWPRAVSPGPGARLDEAQPVLAGAIPGPNGRESAKSVVSADGAAPAGPLE